MPIITGITKYFTNVFENSVTMTLGGSISSGAATVPVNGMTNYVDGDVVCFTVDPASPALKQVFTGVKSGSNIINVTWTEGTNQPHLNGASVIDYVSATDWDLLTKGIKVHANQDGTLIGSAVRTALGQVASTGAGWITLASPPDTVTANGNNSYQLVFNTTDLTSTLSPGMRLLLQRTVAAPTKSSSLNGTTQYFSRASASVAGMTFTDDFAVSGWIKFTAQGSNSVIVSRFDGTSGWQFYLDGTGRLNLWGAAGGSGNSRAVTSYQSIPLNKWVHVAAQLDMSSNVAGPTLNYMMIGGVDVPAFTSTAGTNPTALIQAGNLEIGSGNASQFFPGKIAQLAIYSAKVTQATILASMNQTLTGSETSLVSAYTFNNAVTDLSANANTLTPQASAVATNADSPFGGQADGSISSTLEYGIIMKIAFSTNTTMTVQVPEGCALPTTGGITAASYASVAAPYGMPIQDSKWFVEARNGNANLSTVTAGNWVNPGKLMIYAPIGAWDIGYEVSGYQTNSVNGEINPLWGISTGPTTGSIQALKSHYYSGNMVSNSSVVQVSKSDGLDVSTAALYYFVASVNGGAGTIAVGFEAGSGDAVIRLKNGYV